LGAEKEMWERVSTPMERDNERAENGVDLLHHYAPREIELNDV
jgi:hypothetical protein